MKLAMKFLILLNPLKFWEYDYEVIKSHFSNFGRLLVDIGGVVATDKKNVGNVGPLAVAAI